MTTRLIVTLACGIALLGTGCGEPCDPSVPGVICTVAGSGNNGYDAEADDTALNALDARMSLPQDMLAADDGSLYILDWNNHRIRRLDPEDGMLHWVAGRGELGGTLDDPANNDFNHPTNLLFDPSGTRLVIAAWHNSMIRTYDLNTAEITNTCGDGRRAYFGDGESAVTAALDLPASIAYSPEGDLVIMDQANQVLRRVDAEGNIHLLAGRCVVDAPAPGGPGPCAEGVEPTQCPDGMGGPSGKYVCGDPMEFCGRPCTPGYAGDEMPASELRMSQPFGQSATPAGRIAYDADGNLYFADTANHLIRMIDTDGIVHRVAGQPPVDGVPTSGYAGDGGPALDATLNYPVDIEIADDGTVYFSDVQNHCIRAIATDGTISTAAGVCTERGFEGDGGPPTEALFNLPFGIEWAPGVLYVADSGNSVIRAFAVP